MIEWLQLVVTLPTSSATARMRIWRSLKALGCGALRDGVYVLPRNEAHAEAFRRLAEECVQAGGTAWLVVIEPLDPSDDLRSLFDRSEDFAAMRRVWSEVSKVPASEASRSMRRLERDFDALLAIDFFPQDASLDAQQEWISTRARLQRMVSPDEPQDTAGDVPRLSLADYQGKTWATRRRLWVDRVASAWLIRRFIDPQASFVWIERPADCPPGALGFDFDGAAFTHVGDLVTFEVLMKAFGLATDPALVRLAALVHFLDVGGDPVPEAKGFETLMAGARERLPNDDALLAEMTNALDSFHTSFQGVP